MKFAYDENGNFKGFYENETSIDYKSVQVNSEVWQQLLNGMYKINLVNVDKFKDIDITLENYKELFIEIDNNIKLNTPPLPTSILGQMAIALKFKSLELINQNEVLGQMLVQEKFKNAQLGQMVVQEKFQNVQLINQIKMLGEIMIKNKLEQIQGGK